MSGYPPRGEQNQLLSVSMSMEDPKEVDDTLYLLDATSRQSCQRNAVREWIAALEAQGKRVVVIGMDSPRPQLLGAAMAFVDDPDMRAVDVFRSQHSHLLEATKPTFLKRPSVGKTMLTSSNPMDFQHRFLRDKVGQWVSPFCQPWDTEFLPLPITLKSIDPIPKAIVKKEKNKLKFLDGLGYKKRKYGR